MTLDAWIAGHARFQPGKPAIRFAGETIDYRDLDRHISATAALLRDRFGLKHGERIAWYGMNHPEVFVLAFAAARLGLVLVPLNWRLAVPELQFIVADCRPKVLFYDRHFRDNVADLAEAAEGCRAVAVSEEAGTPALPALRAALPEDAVVREAAPDAAIGDPLLIVYTSGTTGRPKGAVLSQQAVRCNADMSRHAHDMTAADHVLNVLPLFHVGGLNIQPVPALLAGATVTVHERFAPDAALDAISADGITLITVVPTVLQAMIASPNWQVTDLTSLRAMAIGSTDVPRDLIDTVHSRGVPVIQIYGATETGPLAIYQRIEHAVSTAGSIGRCGLLCRARLVGEGGADVAPGEAGEIWIKGDNVLTRYWNDDTTTGLNLVDGWFRTGDVARLDPEGNYWFADRIKHVIISGGENIYPAELERVLREMPGLKEAAVVGRPDAKWGAIPVVVAVKARDDVTREEVLQHFEGRIARFKRPRDVVFVEALPRNALGKVVVDEVRRLVG